MYGETASNGGRGGGTIECIPAVGANFDDAPEDFLDTDISEIAKNHPKIDKRVLPTDGNSRRLRTWRHIHAAVINRALEDLTSSFKIRQDSHRHVVIVDKKEYESAREFILSGDSAFDKMCEFLNLNAGKIKQFAIRVHAFRETLKDSLRDQMQTNPRLRQRQNYRFKKTDWSHFVINTPM